MNWIALTSLKQLNDICLNSKHKTIGIFKHSTRCGISRMVLQQFEKSFLADTNRKMYYLDLLNYRELSNEIAKRFQVAHESPQLVLIKNGKVTQHASHSSILTINLND